MLVSDPGEAVLSEIASAMGRDDRSPLVVGIGGSVAVGKSTLAKHIGVLASAQTGLSVTIIGTDGFLFSNQVLAERGHLGSKGQPITYDEAALLAVIARIRAGEASVVVPTYSHRTFDVERGELVIVGDVVLIEGVNALQPSLARAYDMAIYLDAEEAVVIDWFVARFLTMVREAESDESSFYRRFVHLDEPGRAAVAASVWSTINGPNLATFVAPTAAHADVVLHLGADHDVVRVTRRTATTT